MGDLPWKQSGDALSALDSDEKMTISNTDSHSGERGGAQSYFIVNESVLKEFELL